MAWQGAGGGGVHSRCKWQRPLKVCAAGLTVDYGGAAPRVTHRPVFGQQVASPTKCTQKSRGSPEEFPCVLALLGFVLLYFVKCNFVTIGPNKKRKWECTQSALSAYPPVCGSKLFRKTKRCIVGDLHCSVRPAMMASALNIHRHFPAMFRKQYGVTAVYTAFTCVRYTRR